MRSALDSFFFFVFVFLFLPLLPIHLANAATITPNSTLDSLSSGDGLCTLREAMINANDNAATYSDCTAGTGNDQIALTGGQTYNLTIQNVGASATDSGTDEDVSATGDLDIKGNLIIRVTASGGSTTATVDGGGAAGAMDRIFEVAGTGITVGFKNLTITNGHLSSPLATAKGGAIYSYNANTLHFINCTISDNITDGAYTYAGGIYSEGSLTISNSVISGNASPAGDGGGIYSDGVLEITGSRISDNTGGGGIRATGTIFDMSDSLVSGNTNQSAGGGGLSFESIDIKITNSTISGNSSSYTRGGGIFLYDGVAKINNSTITDNSVTNAITTVYGGGIYAASSSAVIKMKSSILSGNTLHGLANLGTECYSSGTWESYGYNYIASAATGSDCVFTEVINPGTDNITSTHSDLRLGILASNGGATETHALSAGSPAIDAGGAACTDIDGVAVSTDQIGQTRSANCDIGAYENLFVCGDGSLDLSTEVCDDGNTTNGDGCSSICAVEYCGDGVTNNTSETCDDGGTVNGDGCSSVCVIEACVPVCGDGSVTCSEACDDGNTASGDGCSSICAVEYCGDGVINNTSETCDDHNTTPSDGCSATCQSYPPVANAGSDLSLAPLGASTTITLNGTASYDPDRDRITYYWTVVSYPGASAPFIVRPGKAITDVTLNVAGNYTFRLTVKDSVGLSATDDIVVTLR